jgi:3-methyladenine DNA glycosylase AlkC
MAEPLKAGFGPPVVHRLAGMLATAYPDFNDVAFIADGLNGFEALELLPRARHLADVMHRHLPTDFAQAGEILLASLGPPAASPMNQGMAPFLYLPHSVYIGRHGLDHFELSMRVQHALTQRFTAEFCIRPFLEAHPAATLARLAEWAHDPSEQVRRLVSEGTRPRLPWAPRLRGFQRDPAPVLALLEHLKDDPSLYVRRSVANNLNDIGKDHPALLVDVARRWLVDATPERRWIVGHALRSAVKRGEPGALGLLGYGRAARVELRGVGITPPRLCIGDNVVIEAQLHNPGKRRQRLLVDLIVHYVKARGGASRKVFKLTAVELAPGAQAPIVKRLSTADLSTRRHHPGAHRVELFVNGQPMLLGHFELQRA